jgi:hypothetical protein
MLKKRLKPVYLLFLAIPLAYLLLWNGRPAVPQRDSKLPDYIYFSARASKPASLILVAGKDSLITWNLNSDGFKNLEYVGPVNDSAGLAIVIKGLSIHDTITINGFNIYRKGHLYSLCSNSTKNISADNATLTEANRALNAILQHTGKPARINLQPLSHWDKDKTNSHYALIICLFFIIAFILLIVIAPPAKYFTVTVIVSLFVMLLTYIADFEFVGQATMSNNLPIKNAEIYYSHNPMFSNIKKYSSCESSCTYSVPLDFEKDAFLRFDVDEKTKELTDFTINIKWGLFGSSYDLAKLPQGNLVLNDLVLKGNTYRITGNDPYIALSSAFFAQKMQWLIFLQHNIFLFITLLVFVFIVSIHRFAIGLDKLKLHWTYLLILLIPLTYYIITLVHKKEITTVHPDSVYFSARTSKPSVISLFNGIDSVTSWELNSPAFKYFQYDGALRDSAGFFLRINNLAPNDTISLLSVNLYHDNYVYSLFNKNESICTIRNASIIDKAGEINAIVKSANTPVVVNLLPFDLLQKDKHEHRMNIIIVLVIFLTFIIVALMSPRKGYLVVSGIIASLLMVVYSWLCRDTVYNISMSTGTPMKGTEFYYNNRPNFLSSQKLIINKDSSFYDAQIGLDDYKFLRCDVADTLGEVKDLHICAKAGILGVDWNYGTIPRENILLNDMVKHGETYSICGNDPYFILTSADQIHSIQWMTTLRQNIFFFLAILFFLILLFADGYFKFNNLTAFLLSAVFFLIISSEIISHVFNSRRLMMESERRLPNYCPDLRQDSLNTFAKKFDKYLEDQLTGRKNINTINNLIEYSIFNELADNPNVFFGKDGWMFFVGETAREAFENRHPLTPEQLEKMKEVLVARRDWLKQRGIYFYLIFPPMAYSVYEENLGPRLFRHNKKSKLDQLLEYLKKNTDLDVIDIYTPIMEAKKKYPYELYYKTDVHWNYVGAYVAYRAMIDCMKKDFPDIGDALAFKDIFWFQFDDRIGVLLKLIALEDYLTNHECFPCSKYLNAKTDTLHPVYPEYVSPEDPLCIVNRNVHRPKMLMFRDSFSFWLIKYLTNHFSSSTYLWTPIFYPSIIEKEKPDIVIQEMADHFILNILTPNPPLPALKDTIQN